MPRKGEIDPLWETMQELFGRVVSGTNAHKRRNKALKDLRLMDAQPSELSRALSSFNRAFPGAHCTDIALATHFPQFRPKEIAPACDECGMSPPMHVADCSRASR